MSYDEFDLFDEDPDEEEAERQEEERDNRELDEWLARPGQGTRSVPWNHVLDGYHATPDGTRFVKDEPPKKPVPFANSCEGIMLRIALISFLGTGLLCAIVTFLQSLH